jgi:hypothetical protein
VRSSTTVGNLDSPWDPTVDQRGLVTPWFDGWSLDWWIGADDRWHLPSREVAVRQRLVDDMPVVETAMRVPSGDIVQRVYCVRNGEDELVIVEIENQSPLPVALALAVRPVTAEGVAVVKRIELHDGTTVTVNGRVAMLLPRSPSRMAGSTAKAGDVESIVRGGEAGDRLAPVDCPDRGASAAFIWPLPHRQTIRIGLPIVPAPHTRRRRLALPAALPSAQQVANGWRLQGDRGIRLVLPDERLQSAVDANRRFLLLLHDSTARRAFRDAAYIIGALDRYGFADEAIATLRSYEQFLDGGTHHGQAADVALQLGFAELDAGDRRALSRLSSMLDGATPTWTWPDAADGHSARAAAELLLFVRNLLVRDVGGGLALCTLVPDHWLGRPLEVHDAPTQVGRLSFALRWHGDRPALLWELDANDDVDDVTITVPGLDPSWSTTERRGEALLAPVLPPGTPVTLRR